MAQAAQGQPYELSFDIGETGLVGTIEFRLSDGDGAIVEGPTTAGWVETSAGSGIYTYSGAAAPATLGDYVGEASNDGTFTVGNIAGATLQVVTAGALGTVPPLTPIEADGPTPGPCQAWVDSDTVADCCAAFEEASDSSPLTEYAQMATEILNVATGEKFLGECGPVTVRPRGTQTCGCWRGYATGGWSWAGAYWTNGAASCGCSPTSEIRLAGAPIREILEVKIDGDPLDDDEYELRGNRLIRMRDLAEPGTRILWPSCQIRDLPDTEPGTFSVTYMYGMNPPRIGQQAAAELACQLYAACGVGAGEAEECELPEGVTRIVRAGLTMEIVPLVASALLSGETGLPFVDTFLGTFGVREGERGPARSAVFSPDLPWPEPAAAAGGS